MIRALVVDDSSFMRQAISMMLERASDITVVDTAVNGAEGVEKACQLEPDVVTMDVEMPKMDGITAVKKIMKRAPCPILMVSSLTEEGAEVTIEAMRAGAADFVPKGHAHTSLQIKEVEDELIEKVRALSQSRSRLFQKDSSTAPDAKKESSEPGGGSRSSDRTVQTDANLKLVVIGISTGGPMALQHLVPDLPADLPVPIAITQHMPPHFTRSLADRLDSLSTLDVVEAQEGHSLEPGQIVVAAGGRHLTFEPAGSGLRIRTPKEPQKSSYCPSVDVMFESACDAYGGRVLGVIMTGMGDDGLRGARTIKRNGGRVFAQSEASCVVYGMPRVVAEAGLVDSVLSLEELPGAVGEAVGAPALS